MSLLSLGGFFSDIWMSIWLSLNDFVYSIISVLYQVFEGVANVNLFSEEVFKDITSRIYIIMGIAMLFIFAYNLILMIINPEEKKSTGQTTKIVKETIISLVLVILLPTIFNYMSIFQSHVLKSGIISQIIIGDTGGTSGEDCDYSGYTIYNEYDIGKAEDTSFMNWKTILSVGIYQIYLNTKDSTPTTMLTESCEHYYSNDVSPSQRGAYALPTTIFQAFYHPTRVDYNSCEEWIQACKNDKECSTEKITDPEDKEMCAYYVYDVKLAKYMGNIAPFNSESKFYSKVKADDGTFEFNGLMALIAGVLALYMFACYTIAIGTRVAKLGFLQLISPIAVMMRIVPTKKESMFEVWKKNLINTYLDVFIRLMIIYFSLFAVSLVPDVITTLFETLKMGSSWWVVALSSVVVILGILMFAQQAPDLLKQFIPSAGGGNFALKSPKKQWEENKLAKGGVMGAMGAIGGGLSSMAGNAWNSWKNVGAGQGWKSNAKNIAGGVLSGTAGLFSGVKSGAKYGYGAKNLKDLKGGIVSAKSDNDAARARHKAVRDRGIKGNIDYAKENLVSGWSDLGDFITGNSATNEKATAFNAVLAKITGISDAFEDGLVKSVKSAQNKINEDYHSNKKVNVNGVDYERRSDGLWHGTDRSSISHKIMGDKIKDAVDEMKKNAYATSYGKNPKALENFTTDMLKSLESNMSKFGSEFNDSFFASLGVRNFDDLSNKMNTMIQNNEWANIYELNDAIEKEMKKQVAINKSAMVDKKDK